MPKAGIPLDADRVVELYKSGVSSWEIGKMLGCGPNRVGYLLRKAGVAMRQVRRIDWPVDQMRKWYEEDGLTCAEIGILLGEGTLAVNKACRRFGFRMRKTGVQGSKHPCWKGGRLVDKHGYILIYSPDHPRATKSGRVREHRLVMEKFLGRFLLPSEVVHHKNNDPADNRIENLEVFDSNAQHLAETLKGQCPNWTEDGLRRMLDGGRKWRESRASQN